MTLATFIGSLSHDEKLAALDLLWGDLSSDSASFASPQWHASVLAERLENPVNGPALPLADARAEVKDSLDARRTSS